MIKLLHLAGYFHCIDVGLAIRVSSEDTEAPVPVGRKQQLQLITFEGFAEVGGLHAADFSLEVECSSQCVDAPADVFGVVDVPVQVDRAIGHAHPFGLTVDGLRFQSLKGCGYYFRPVVGQVQIELGQIPGSAAVSVQDHPFAGGLE